MSTWALLVMVLLVLLAAGIVLLASRRSRTAHAATVAAPPERAPGRTVQDLVRDRTRGAEERDEPVVEERVESNVEPDLESDAAPSEVPQAAPAAAAAEPTVERRVDPDVDAGPVGPPWNRGFVDGVPVEGPPRPKPTRRSTVDPALVARVTSVAPPADSSEERPVARGIVSPAVADAVARARSRGERPPLAAVPDLPDPPRSQRYVASGASVAGLALAGIAAARVDEAESDPAESDQAESDQAEKPTSEASDGVAAEVGEVAAGTSAETVVAGGGDAAETETEADAAGETDAAGDDAAEIDADADADPAEVAEVGPAAPDSVTSAVAAQSAEAPEDPDDPEDFEVAETAAGPGTAASGRSAADTEAEESGAIATSTDAAETAEVAEVAEPGEVGSSAAPEPATPEPATPEPAAAQAGTPDPLPAPLTTLPSPRDGAGAEPRPVLAVLPGGVERRLRAVPAFAASGDTPAGSVIETPADGAGARPVTLSAVTPSPAAPRSTSTPGIAPTEDPRAAEHAAVDLALLRTLGFADPNPRNGVSPVVDMSVEHPEEDPEPPGRPTPVAFRVHGRDHGPVADATVALLDPRGREAATAAADAEGRGTVTAPRPGGYVLVASAQGHQPGVVAVRAEQDTAVVEVPLVRSSTITGRLRDAEGSPVAEAALELLQDGELVGSATTDADGAYRFAELAAGDYTVAVQAGGHEPLVVGLRLAEEAEAVQDVVLPAGVVAPHLG